MTNQITEELLDKLFFCETEVVNYGQQLRADYQSRDEAYAALAETSCKKELYDAVMLYYAAGCITDDVCAAIGDSIT